MKNLGIKGWNCVQYVIGILMEPLSAVNQNLWGFVKLMWVQFSEILSQASIYASVELWVEA